MTRLELATHDRAEAGNRGGPPAFRHVDKVNPGRGAQPWHRARADLERARQVDGQQTAIRGLRQQAAIREAALALLVRHFRPRRLCRMRLHPQI